MSSWRWLTLFALAAACSGSARPGPSNSTTSQSEIPTESAAGSAGGDTFEQAGAPSAGEPNSAEAVALGGAPAVHDAELLEVTAGGDATLELSPHEFLPPTEELFTFDRAAALGERRLALDTTSLALMTFDAHGQAPSMLLEERPLAAVGRGDELVVLELDAQGGLVAATYDQDLVSRGAELSLAPAGTGAHALASSTELSTAVWSQAGELRGLLFDARGAIGEGFDFGPQSCGARACTARVVYDGSRFSVVWSRVSTSGQALVSWGTIDAQGAALAATNVLGAAEGLSVEDAVALPEGRLAVLLTLGTPAREPLLLFLDSYGRPETDVLVYPGASAAWSLASDGQSLLMAARSSHAQGVIRWLDLQGQAKSDWLVVDDSGSDTEFEPRVALMADKGSYAAIVRMTDGSAATLDLDPADFPAP
jgi:hypothetical protein